MYEALKSVHDSGLHLGEELANKVKNAVEQAAPVYQKKEEKAA